MKKYVLDTNVIIDLKNFNSKVFKSLWKNINNLIENKTIYSITEVQRELINSEDLLYEKWEQINQKHDFFIDLSEKENSEKYWTAIEKLDSFKIFQKYGENKKYWADPYLIATSIVDGDIIITNETIYNKKERKIPYICQKLNIPCITFDDFMIKQGWEW